MWTFDSRQAWAKRALRLNFQPPTQTRPKSTEEQATLASSLSRALALGARTFRSLSHALAVALLSVGVWTRLDLKITARLPRHGGTLVLKSSVTPSRRSIRDAQAAWMRRVADRPRLKAPMDPGNGWIHGMGWEQQGPRGLQKHRRHWQPTCRHQTIHPIPLEQVP